MEVAAFEMVACIREDKRIVVGRVEFHGYLTGGIGDGVPGGAMHLRRTAHGVGILHARVSVPMRFAQATALHHPTDIVGDIQLAGIRTQAMNTRVERCIASAQRFDADGGGNVRHALQSDSPVHGQSSHGRHHLRSVDERQSLLCRQPDRGDLRTPQCRSRRPRTVASAHVKDSPTPHHRKHQMRQLHQISACSHRALRRDDRNDTRIQHPREHLDRLDPNARMSLEERVDA